MDAMAGAPDRVVTVLTPPSIAEPEPVEDEELSSLDTMPMPLADQPSRPVPSRSANSTGPIAFAGATIARLRRGRGRRGGTDALPISTTEQLTLAEPDTAPAEPAIVLAEENKLRQVVTNLVG